MAGKIKDLTGKAYGRVRVVSFAFVGADRSARWNCECQCGKRFVTQGSSLVSGHAKSCGCLKADTAAAMVFRHGRSFDRTYNAWYRMHRRCSCNIDISYRYYKGRGICICSRWKSFDAFLEDMGECPPNGSLDRINNNGNYEPSNCRWATAKEQARNRRNNRIIEFRGESLPASVFCERHGLTVNTFLERLKRNWTVEEALTRPLRGADPIIGVT